MSEKIALGQAQATATGELMYDTRLFNQADTKIDSLNDDAAYNLYDKPLFSSASQQMYRPRKGLEQEADRLDTSRFKVGWAWVV